MIIALVFSLGCTQSVPDNNVADIDNTAQFILGGDNMADEVKVKDGDNVTLNYTLSLADGTVYQTTIGSNPATFDIKYPGLIKGFYDAVIGMKVEDKKTITLPPEEAYGELKVQYVDINMFQDQIQVKKGKIFSAGNSEIKIISVDGNTIGIADRLSGETLTFDIEIISIN